jgi:hypothetical protein
MSAFLSHYRLAALVSWELPLPQGPLDNVPVGLAAKLLGPNAPVRFDPSYPHLPGSDVDVGADRRRSQYLAAESDGLGAEHPESQIGRRGGRPSIHENAFRCWLIERALVRRYSGRRGFATRVQLAFEEVLGVGAERVIDIREVYLPKLRGPEPPQPGPFPGRLEFRRNPLSPGTTSDLPTGGPE